MRISSEVMGSLTWPLNSQLGSIGASRSDRSTIGADADPAPDAGIAGGAFKTMLRAGVLATMESCATKGDAQPPIATTKHTVVKTARVRARPGRALGAQAPTNSRDPTAFATAIHRVTDTKTAVIEPHGSGSSGKRR